ncbi:MAG: hypothetical protein MHPSP_002550, partial [Paramarteilia canceri]
MAARKLSDHDCIARLSRLVERRQFNCSPALMNEILIARTSRDPDFFRIAKNIGLPEMAEQNKNVFKNSKNEMTYYYRVLNKFNDLNAALEMYPKIATMNNGAMLTVLQKFIVRKYKNCGISLMVALIAYQIKCYGICSVHQTNIGWLLQSFVDQEFGSKKQFNRLIEFLT